MMTRSLKYLIASCLMVISLAGCIKNDIPYPRIQANILYFSVEGQTQSAAIDSATRIVTVTLGENVDITAVKVDSFAITPGSKITSGNLDQSLNLSRPQAVGITLYQEYWWVIKAEQNISRNFSIAGQIGTSVIDVPARRVIVTVPETMDLSQVKVLSCKLAGSEATMEPDIVGRNIDLTRPFSIDVTEHGRTETWTVYADITTSTVTTVSVDAWSRVAWAHGQAEEGKRNGFQYRLSSSEEWTDVPTEWITYDGGSFTARIIHLQPETEYAARAYSDDEYATEIVFTTGSEPSVPNGNFEYWWLNGKVWNPWPQDGQQWWDTGNKGATTLGASNSVPADGAPTATGTAAKLETKFVGIGPLGKLAAGNIFAGYYVKTDGTNGILSFGRPFTQRPTRLKGLLKYNCAEISHSSSEYAYLKGRPDTCIVWTALIDSDEPFEIRTNPKNQHLFDPDGPEVIAYGNFQMGQSVNDYISFTVDLDYKSTSRIPNYILMVASASKYGDYFTGGNGSILYVTDLKLEYDY